MQVTTFPFILFVFTTFMYFFLPSSRCDCHKNDLPVGMAFYQDTRPLMAENSDFTIECPGADMMLDKMRTNLPHLINYLLATCVGNTIREAAPGSTQIYDFYCVKEEGACNKEDLVQGVLFVQKSDRVEYEKYAEKQEDNVTCENGANKEYKKVRCSKGAWLGFSHTEGWRDLNSAAAESFCTQPAESGFDPLVAVIIAMAVLMCLIIVVCCCCLCWK